MWFAGLDLLLPLLLLIDGRFYVVDNIIGDAVRHERRSRARREVLSKQRECLSNKLVSC